MSTKTCGKCREVRPVSEFSRDRSSRDGLQSRCKACRVAHNATYCATHPERVAAYRAAYHVEHRDDINARNAAYYAAHRDESAAYRAARRDEKAATNAAWYAKNRERIAAYGAEHRDEKAAYDAAYHVEHRERRLTNRTRRRGATIIEEVDPRILFERAMGICHICSLPVDPDRWDVDHVIPLSAGGVHSYDNTAVSHPSCNQSKGNRTP